MDDERWYKEGLRFTCTQCGDCCTGSEGFVWVNKEEISALATAVGQTDVAQFEQLYTRKIGIRKSLKEFPNGDCVFFDGETRKCTVYQARPRQCRTWPFWNSNVRSKVDWERTCEECPGAGKGKLYQLTQIEAQRGVMKI